MEIVCIERVIIAVKNLADARENWRKAGFGLAAGIPQVGGLRWTRLAAGAVAIDLCAIDGEPRNSGMLREAVESKLAQGGGIVGWVWGARGSDGEHHREERLALPGWNEAESEALVMRDGVSGVSTAIIQVESDADTRRARLLVWCPLPMLLLAHSERGTEHFFPRPLTRSGGRGKNVVGGGEGFRIRDAKPRRSAEAGQDSFPWPTTPIAASQPLNEIG